MIDLLRSKTARNSYLNLIGLAVPLVIGVALVPITMRGLGIPRYGLLSLALTVLEYSALFALGPVKLLPVQKRPSLPGSSAVVIAEYVL